MKYLTAKQLKQLLYTQIPLTKSMGIEVIQAEPTCAIVSAPLQPNINHQGTAFGGSANTLAIVSAYSLLFLRLNTTHPHCHVLIQQNTMQYQRPIEGEMIARCEFEDAVCWSRFMKTLQRHGRARISLDAVVTQNEQRCASFKGDFVALCH